MAAAHRPLARDSILKIEDLFDSAIVSRTPDMRAASRFDQLNKDTQAGPHLLDAALEYISDAELITHFTHIHPTALVSAGGHARDDEERANARECGSASTDRDLEPAFATFSQQHVGAVLVSNSTLYTRRTEQLAALAARDALPAIFPYSEFVLAGGLMSYGSSLGYAYHRAGIYTGRILKGEKPADLPVEQATRIVLTLNLKTAKALGIEFPTGLLCR
jgi:hypothetical protein